MFVGTIEVTDLLKLIGAKDLHPGQSRSWALTDEGCGARANLFWDADASVIRADVVEWNGSGSNSVLSFDADIDEDEAAVFCHDDQISAVTYDLFALLEAFSEQIQMMKEIK